MIAARVDADANIRDIAPMLGTNANKKQINATAGGFRCSSSGEKRAKPAHATVDGIPIAKKQMISRVYSKAGTCVIRMRMVAIWKPAYACANLRAFSRALAGVT